jgi:hypothetical protein
MVEKRRTNGRARGGQPGNTNALKHGIYSRSFNDMDISDLAMDETEKLQSEIDMLRVAISKVFACMAECSDPEELRSHLEVLAMAALKVAVLMKVQRYLEENRSKLVDTINQTILEVSKEMNLTI